MSGRALWMLLLAAEAGAVVLALRRHDAKVAEWLDAAARHLTLRLHRPVEVEPCVLICTNHRGSREPSWPCADVVRTVEREEEAS